MYTEKLDFKPNAVWLLRWTVLLYNMRRPFMKYQTVSRKENRFYFKDTVSAMVTLV